MSKKAVVNVRLVRVTKNKVRYDEPEDGDDKTGAPDKMQGVYVPKALMKDLCEYGGDNPDDYPGELILTLETAS
jgi:hypothetical protein